MEMTLLGKINAMLTPLTHGADPYAKRPAHEHWFEAWGGLLAGYALT
jgi:hypothetical protein